MLWEILGLGAGSLPLTLRFKPMIGGVLYWSRPGTTRLPPWPDRVPLTRGTTRTPIDVALYAGVLFWLGYLLFTDGVTDPTRPRRPPRPGRGRDPARAPRRCSACATRSPSSRPGRRSTGT